MTDPTYPPTRTVDAADVLHGETIPDPYRWLEDGSDSDTRAWTEQQNALTEDWLARRPGRQVIRRRLDQLLSIGAISVPAPARGRSSPCIKSLIRFQNQSAVASPSWGSVTALM